MPAPKLSHRPFVRISILALFVFVAAGCSKGTPDEHLRKGDEFFEQKKHAEAILEYSLGLRLDPKRGDIQLKLADAYAASGNGNAAQRAYIVAADLLPNDVRAQLRAGSFLLLGSAFEDAKTRAERAIRLDPKNADAQVLLGNALLGMRDFGPAIDQYLQAIALNPAQEQAYQGIARIHIETGRRDEAEATFRRARVGAPKSTPVRIALANFLWASNRTSEAEDVFKQVLAIEPDNIAANRALGVMYMTSNRTTEAETYFQALVAKTKSVDAKLGLADYYVIARRFEDARKILTALAATDEGYAAHTRLAVIEAGEGKRAQALDRLLGVLRTHPKDSQARLLRARLLLADGKRDDALREANLIVADRESAEAGDGYVLIGRIQNSMDRPEDAIAAYEEALKTPRVQADALIALGNISLNSGDITKAKGYSEQALSAAPNNVEARVLEARVLVAQGKAADAAARIGILEKAAPKSTTVLNLVARRDFDAGKTDAARANFLKALELAPDNSEALAGITLIDINRGKVQEAVARIEAALRTGTPTAEFFSVASQAYSLSGNSRRAEELLKQSIDLYPDRLQAYGFLGQLYIQNNRLQDAADQFRTLAQRNPKSISAGTMLGLLLQTQGKFPEAEREYLRVLGIDSKAAVASNNLAWQYVSSGRNLDTALQLAQNAYRQLPNEAAIADTLGWVYVQKGLHTSAIPILEAASKRSPSEPAIRYHLGMAYLGAGRKDRARIELQAALSSKDPFEGIEDARKAMASLGR